jgi:sulfur carrier protein ThiS
VITILPGDSLLCPEGYTLADGRCYRVVIERAATAFHADIQCVAEGAQLASISGAAESAAVGSIFSESGALVMPFIGLYFDVFGQTFRWTSGASYLYVNWAVAPSLQPRSTCVAISPTGTWTTVSCDDRRPFICERSAIQRNNYITLSTSSTAGTVSNAGNDVAVLEDAASIDDCLQACDSALTCAIAIFVDGIPASCILTNGATGVSRTVPAAFTVFRKDAPVTLPPVTTPAPTTVASTTTVETAYELTFGGAVTVNNEVVRGSRFNNIFVSDDQIEVLNDSSVEACQAACTAESTCAGFFVYTSSNVCVLLSRVGGEARNSLIQGLSYTKLV